MDMEEVDLDQLRERALAWHAAGKSWHFHVLSPACVFNERDEYAYIGENTTDEEYIVAYAAVLNPTLPKELAPLIHGAKILDEGETASEPSARIAEMTRLAQELTNLQLEWHHHMLFPQCRLNRHRPSYVITIEDPRNGELHESVTDYDPTAELKGIEMLYHQNNEARKNK